MSIKFAGADVVESNCMDRDAYGRLEIIKAQICRLSLWNIIRCTGIKDDFSLASHELKRNFLVRAHA